MNEIVVFVDFENFNTIDLDRLPSSARLEIFYGAHQNKPIMALAQRAKRLRLPIDPIEVREQGRNALDFHIAFHLGRVVSENPSARCIILSADKGFDALVGYMERNGYDCRRVPNQFEWLPPLTDNAKRVVDQLAKVERPKRPRKRDTLRRHAESRFGGRLTDSDLSQLMAELFDKRLVSETRPGDALIYSF